ncbi:MAG TPA: GDP-L-fucose synthase [Candidatus Brocadiaceae bacterium]|nr:GDP-L-fucose synthase [Candidatus Brocadiaceae bacterium]
MDKNSKIYIAGIYGMVGSAIKRRLQSEGYINIIGHTSKELDLTNQDAVNSFMLSERPEYVFLAAAKVGGIYANNTYPADFIYRNLMVECNVIHSAYKSGVKKLLFLGSSCIYPKYAPQPMKEEYLLSGKLEPTNEPYALAKIAGIKLCEAYNRQHGTDFISCMPTNLYGTNDNYDPMNSHVIPALIRRFHEAKIKIKAEAEDKVYQSQPDIYSQPVVIWGTGTPRREFLYVDDLADACVYLMKHYSGSETINVGSGSEVTIRELTEIIKEVTGFEGDIVFDSSKPDGTPRKLLDTSRLNALGWEARTGLKEGLKLAYDDYCKRTS